MSPPTDHGAHFRTPHGAFYRTPHGAFGYEAEPEPEPTPDFSVQGSFGSGREYSSTGCSMSFRPQGQGESRSITELLGGGPLPALTMAQWRTATIVGRITGNQWMIRGDDFICQSSSLFPPFEDFYYYKTGPTVPGTGGNLVPEYTVNFTVLGADVVNFNIGWNDDVHPGIDVPGWLVSETSFDIYYLTPPP